MSYNVFENINYSYKNKIPYDRQQHDITDKRSFLTMDFVLAIALTLGTVYLMLKAVQKFPMVLWLFLLILGLCLYDFMK